jgi:hypothetical protein
MNFMFIDSNIVNTAYNMESCHLRNTVEQYVSDSLLQSFGKDELNRKAHDLIFMKLQQTTQYVMVTARF